MGEDFNLKKFLFGRIDRKFLFLITIILIIIMLFGLAILFFQNQNLNYEFSERIIGIKEDFINLQEQNTKTLSVALEVVLQDQNFKQIYLENDRDKLYYSGQSLFENFKNKYNLTHFYFILPNGTNFVRLHNKEQYGDLITRFTFEKAKKNKNIGTGIELGKTAFTLRVVMPYYFENKLIGYVELGQEIDSFLEILKKNSNHEFALIVEKIYIDQEKWKSVRETANLRNNFDDLKNHLVISSTTNEIVDCFRTENVNKILDGEHILERVQIEDKKFICGGFPLIDAGDREVGAVFTLIDSTKIVNSMQTVRIILLVVFLILVFAVINIGFFIKRNISTPVVQLNQVTKQIQEGNFKAKTNIKTGDELEQLGQTFNKMIEALAQMDEERKQLESAKTRFISITSHELRSPMTPLKAQLQMLNGEYFGKLNEKQKESINTVVRNANHLDRIIVDFLEISRIEAARLKFVFKKMSLNKPVQELIKFMKNFIPEKNIKIVSHIDPLPIIEVDSDRVLQVLRNLLNNAIKFSKESGIINVSAKREADHILFSVKDNGIGMKEEDQRRIFEPFYQAEQTIYRKKGGTGLGLAICKGIIESQNGRIWLESKMGKGTTFYFTIPFVPVKQIKAIKILFSEQESLGGKVKELLIRFLGPIAEKEFELLNKQSLKYEFIIEYINQLFEQRIINESVSIDMIRELIVIFGIKKGKKRIKINLSAEIEKLYLNILGPLGKKRFKKLSAVKTNIIIGDINDLENKKILNSKEASSFRDVVMGLFRQQELGGRLVGKEDTIGEKFIKTKNWEEKKVRISYSKYLGSAGTNYFEKIKSNLNLDVIIPQIDLLEARSVLTSKNAKEFKRELNMILK